MKQWYEEKNAPDQGTFLCNVSDIDIGSVKEFEFGESVKTKFRMFVYRDKNECLAYINRCPHFNVPLNMHCGEMFTSDGSQFQCCHHYATFDKKSGICTDGPCEGRSLTKIHLDRAGDKLFIATYL